MLVNSMSYYFVRLRAVEISSSPEYTTEAILEHSRNVHFYISLVLSNARRVLSQCNIPLRHQD